ncbi:LPXTG cell wall anchor domain-containing protein, partial [Listeria monocytogenes]|nr:LPXTG cell wall anchor domain-containing protein [Listeria monocytogenes]EEP1906152.1 LPXTG cell wall anchor domain-containing protein [Listeria monocytogenes]
YTYKEVKGNTSTTGTLSNEFLSLTFIYTKDSVKITEPISSGSSDEGNKNTSSIKNTNYTQNNILPKTGDSMNMIPIIIGFSLLFIASSSWWLKRKQYRK